MKKILSLLSAIGMTATGGSMVIGCHFGVAERVPNDLAQFSQADFKPLIIGWLTEKSQNQKNGWEILDEVEKVVIEYLTNNNVELNFGDLILNVKINDQNLAINDEVTFDSSKKYDITITGFVPNYITSVKNQINVQFKNFGLINWDINEFANEFNNKEFKNYKQLLGKGDIEGFNKMLSKIIAEIFADKYQTPVAIRNIDYEFKIFDSNGHSFQPNTTIDFTKNSIQLWLKLHNQTENIWSSENWIFGNLKINSDDKFNFEKIVN